VAIDFGQHVAALWEDRDPCGRLGGNDLVVHHLGGLPEIVTLETLTKDRPVFSLRVPRSPIAECAVKIAGDVVMAEDDRWVIPGFEKRGAAVFLANLEGVPSASEPDHEPRYDFRFPAARLSWLKDRGIDAVSLANNHAGDAGRAGLVEGLSALKRAGLGVFGAGRNETEACQPWRIERDGVRLAVFGVCMTDAMAATASDPGVVILPDHASQLEVEIRKARADGELVLAIIHGGDEYQTTVNSEQRKWVRWLTARGANLIAGAHPHVVQREEFHGGSKIVHSLGNAVYPKSLKGADSGRIQTFHLSTDGSVR
jgi:poly-gamma-glutamate capsule biosynthesis protein CapA/YwtB (metallophosphatase superfamily)